jgi:putative transposase
MSHKYKFQNPEGLYFFTSSIINWIDIFTREDYSQIFIESLDYCRKKLGMEIYAWCLMPSHLHLVIRAQGSKPELILGKFKEFTSKRIQLAVKQNPVESRKYWLVLMFE